MTRLSRRTFLRGAGGVAVALPALEIMGLEGAVSADVGTAPPKRFLTSYGGMSMPPRDLVVPAGVGAGYTPTRALAPIADLGVRDDVTVVTNLVLPWGTGSDIPPGGRGVYFHYNTLGPQIAGTRGTDERDGKPRGPTADQIVADAIGGSTRFPMIPYRVQAVGYVDGSELYDDGRFSWRRTADGRLEAVDPISSPRAAYESLFTGFTPADSAEAERVRRELIHRRSVLDFVLERSERLRSRLGARDRVRVERHFDEIRALELRLAEIDPTGGACRLLEPPGEDPPLGDWFTYDGMVFTNWSTTRAYSGEDIRGDALTDLVAMAFACDLTRAISFMVTQWKCYMNAYPVNGAETDMHQTTHVGRPDWVADSVAWHVKQFARLARKLADMPEVDGTTVLDHTAMVMLFEGGFGLDVETGDTSSPHSTEDMIALLAGRAGGLRSGLHVDGGGGHPAAVVLAAMNAVGVEGPLGDITEPIAGVL